VKDAAVHIGHGILAYDMAPVQDTGLRIIGVYGKNCEDWVLSDLAANLQGITTVAIYDTLGAESMAFILQQTNLSTLFLAPEMLSTLLKQDKHPAVANLVYFDQFNAPSPADQEALQEKGYKVYSLSQVREKGKSEP
jgi:long-chain acyl-CoA synthetase